MQVYNEKQKGRQKEIQNVRLNRKKALGDLMLQLRHVLEERLELTEISTLRTHPAKLPIGVRKKPGALLHLE